MCRVTTHTDRVPRWQRRLQMPVEEGQQRGPARGLDTGCGGPGEESGQPARSGKCPQASAAWQSGPSPPPGRRLHPTLLLRTMAWPHPKRGLGRDTWWGGTGGPRSTGRISSSHWVPGTPPGNQNRTGLLRLGAVEAASPSGLVTAGSLPHTHFTAEKIGAQRPWPWCCTLSRSLEVESA